VLLTLPVDYRQVFRPLRINSFHITPGTSAAEHESLRIRVEMISHSQNLRTLNHKFPGWFDAEHKRILTESQQTALDAMRIAEQDCVRPVVRHTLQIEPAVVDLGGAQYRDSEGNQRENKGPLHGQRSADHTAVSYILLRELRPVLCLSIPAGITAMVAPLLVVMAIHSGHAGITRLTARIVKVLRTGHHAGRWAHTTYEVRVRYPRDGPNQDTSDIEVNTYRFLEAGDRIKLLQDPKSRRVEYDPFPEVWIVVVIPARASSGRFLQMTRAAGVWERVPVRAAVQHNGPTGRVSARIGETTR
jgi:hypothetical protein